MIEHRIKIRAKTENKTFGKRERINKQPIFIEGLASLKIGLMGK